MITAVLHLKRPGEFYALKILNRRKKTERRVRIKSLQRLCLLISPENVLRETSNEYLSLYQLKTKHHDKAQSATQA